MRVLHVQDLRSLDGARVDGTPSLLDWWWPEFQRSPAEVSLCILRGPDDARRAFAPAGIPVALLGCDRFDPRTPRDLAELVRRDEIDLLHCHGHEASNCGRIAARLTRRPVVIHERDLDSGFALPQRLADRFLARWTDRAIAASNSVAEFLETERAVPRERISVVPDGIPDEFFHSHAEAVPALRAELEVPEGHTVVGSIGPLRPREGHEVFLRAAAEVLRTRPASVFLVVGEGRDRERLEDLAGELRIQEQVRFMPSREDMPALIALCDVLVTASLRAGFALTAAEAMAQAKPVVAARAGGALEMVQDGITGHLVPPADAEAMARAISELLAHPERAAAMGAHGLRLCRERNSIVVAVRRICAIYEELLVDRARRTTETQREQAG